MALHDKVVEFLSSRQARLHHLLWHQIRDTWLLRTTTDKQRKAIEACGWAPNGRPAIDPNQRSIHDNGAGEDFLFMHRQMIQKVRAITEENGGKPHEVESVNGWLRVPNPAVPEFPVPGPWDVYGSPRFTRFIHAVKADSYYYEVMREWERQFTDKVYMRGMPLGEFGSRMESTIHNMMHMRWCDRPWDARTGKQEPALGRPDRDIDKRWDDARYNWLGDTYSSHVYPVFWKLHGWIDDRIEDWFDANKDSSKLEQIELRGVKWFKGDLIQVADPWSGGMDFGMNGDHSHHVNEMEKVAKIILGIEILYTFYQDYV